MIESPAQYRWDTGPIHLVSNPESVECGVSPIVTDYYENSNDFVESRVADA